MYLIFPQKESEAAGIIPQPQTVDKAPIGRAKALSMGALLWYNGNDRGARFMMTRDGGKNRGQIEFTSLDELVPEDHLVRKLENAIDWSFIYEMVVDSYCEDNGRLSLDPASFSNPKRCFGFGL